MEEKKNVRNFKRLVGGVAVLLLMGCSGMEYVSNAGLPQQAAIAEFGKDMEKTRQSMHQYGGFRFTKGTADPADDQVFILKRRGTALLAETQLTDSADYRTYFNVGVERKKRMLGIGFRLEF